MEAGEKSLKHARCWECGYLLIRNLPKCYDITSRISGKRRAMASPIAFPFVCPRQRPERHGYRAQEITPRIDLMHGEFKDQIKTQSGLISTLRNLTTPLSFGTPLASLTPRPC